jgi:hypothetical protein
VKQGRDGIHGAVVVALANLAIAGDGVVVPKEIRGSGEPVLEVGVEEDHRDRVVRGGTHWVKMGAGEGVARWLWRLAVGLWSSSRLVRSLWRRWLDRIGTEAVRHQCLRHGGRRRRHHGRCGYSSQWMAAR